MSAWLEPIHRESAATMPAGLGYILREHLLARDLHWISVARRHHAAFRKEGLISTAEAVQAEITLRETRAEQLRLPPPPPLEPSLVRKAAADQLQSEKLFGSSEHILDDDYPVYAGYWYLVDGIPQRSDYHGISVREFRVRLKASEIRRCAAVQRNLPLAPFS